MKNELKTEINISQKMLRELAILEMNATKLYNYLSEFSNESFFFHIPFEEEIYTDTKEKTNSLEDYLIKQINLLNISKKEKNICFFFLENLDDKGYLNIPFYDLAQKYNINKETLKNTLERFKELEPKGIGARDLRETLIFQSENFPLLKKILTNHYQELISMRFDKIALKIGVSIEEIKKIIEPMRNFISYPRRDFSGQIQSQLRISDIFVSDNLKVSLNDRYDFRLEELKSNSEFKKNLFYEREKRKAEAINASLQKRSTTLLKLGEFIVAYQAEFFKTSTIKALTQEKVADSLGIHVSTVSRACRDKILEYKGKQYELKEFFPRKVGEKNSSWEIKKAIKELIDKEDKKNPYSDEDLKKELEKMGIKTARRTIAKYRDNMGIFRWRLRKTYE